MKAVKDQQEKYEQISKDFAHRLKQHLLGIFQQHVSFSWIRWNSTGLIL